MMIPCNSGAACVRACMHITNPCPSSGPGPGAWAWAQGPYPWPTPLCMHACSIWQPSPHMHEKRISMHNLGGNILHTACSEFCTLYVPERTVLLIRACKPMMPLVLVVIQKMLVFSFVGFATLDPPFKLASVECCAPMFKSQKSQLSQCSSLRKAVWL